MKTLLTSALFIVMQFVIAQSDTIAPQIPLNKLDFMIGEWEGTSWTMTKNGKEQSNVTEKVEYKLDKNIIIVEGLGTKTDSITNKVNKVHNAYGVIFFDSRNNTLAIDAYKNGTSTQSAIKFIEDKVIQWNIDIPQKGKVRFTVDFSLDNKWVEIGEYSKDGDNWMKFLGMELSKKED